MVSTFFARRAGRVLLAVASSRARTSPPAFDFDDVAALARRKARAPYEPPDRVQPRSSKRWVTIATATFVSGPIVRFGEPKVSNST